MTNRTGQQNLTRALAPAVKLPDVVPAAGEALARAEQARRNIAEHLGTLALPEAYAGMYGLVAQGNKLLAMGKPLRREHLEAFKSILAMGGMSGDKPAKTDRKDIEQMSRAELEAFMRDVLDERSASKKVLASVEVIDMLK